MAIIVIFSVAFAILMVAIHFFNSGSTNIVNHEGLFDEPSAVGKVQLSDDDDYESCISSSHWGTESNPGIERVRSRRLWNQFRDLQQIGREAFRVVFEAVNQSRS